jgi:hypothetical protein
MGLSRGLLATNNGLSRARTNALNVIGVGVVELEVLFKGRFSEVGLPASPPV